MTETELDEDPTTHRVHLRDSMLRAMRAKPWIKIGDLVRLVGSDRATVIAELRALKSEGAAESFYTAWALKGAARVPLRHYKQRASITPAAQRMIDAVRADPWKPAGAYAKKKGGARFASYSMLETLTRRGVLQMTSKNGVKCWGPADAPVPPGHMQLRGGARSPKRQGLRERTIALLALKPWQTVPAIARELRARDKTTDTCIRMMLGQGLLQRVSVETVTFNMYAYALPEALAITEDDRARIRSNTAARMPQHYGRTLEKVRAHIQKHPWRTSTEIVAETGISDANVQGALRRLRMNGSVIRVADGLYRYAIHGTELRREVSGVLSKGGPRSKALDLAIEILAATPGLCTDEIRVRIREQTGRNYTGLHGMLSKAEEKGILSSQNGHRKRMRVIEWFLVKRQPRTLDVILGELEARAGELRAQGYTVTIATTPPR